MTQTLRCHFTQCITFLPDGAVVSLQTLGSSVTMISKSAKDGYIDDFCESVRRFAGAVSRIIIIIPQVTSSFDRLLCPVRFVTRFVIRKRTKEQVVKVIRSTVASPPRTGRSVVFARWRECDSHLTAGCWALTQVSRSISIVSSGLAGFASVSATHTHTRKSRHTDHGTCDACANRPHPCDARDAA